MSIDADSGAYRPGSARHNRLVSTELNSIQSEAAEASRTGVSGSTSPGIDAASIQRLRAMADRRLGSSKHQHLLRSLNQHRHHLSLLEHQHLSGCRIIIVWGCRGIMKRLESHRLGLTKHCRHGRYRSMPVGSADRHHLLPVGSQWRFDDVDNGASSHGIGATPSI